jgi:hypothetical protein
MHYRETSTLLIALVFSIIGFKIIIKLHRLKEGKYEILPLSIANLTVIYDGF